jgi:hypothetical protein
VGPNPYPDKYIGDATLDDVSIENDNPTGEEIQRYVDRPVYTKGNPVGHVGEPGAVFIGFITNYKLGFVKKDIFAKLEEGNFEKVVGRNYDTYKYRMSTPESNYCVAAGPLFDDNKNKFCIVPNGFNSGEYSDDVCAECTVVSYDIHCAEPTVKLFFFGKSLLVVTSPEYSILVHSDEWKHIKDRIHEYIDREFLKDIVADLDEPTRRKIRDKLVIIQEKVGPYKTMIGGYNRLKEYLNVNAVLLSRTF